MPELPEVDAITGVVRRHAVDNTLTAVEVVRQNGKYFQAGPPEVDRRVTSVARIGKYIQISFVQGPAIIIHNAMTGYFDWKHEPWTFDYVEGKRESTESDVRVRFDFTDGKILRFHDARLFGFMFESDLGAPLHGPELMTTPNMHPNLREISLEEFARGIFSEKKRTIKSLLMDQDFLSGIGNIYSNEGLHLAGVDPRTISDQMNPSQVPILLDALRCCVEHSIPTVRYDWLKVYRRSNCGTCSGKIMRVEIEKRSTFICDRCQV